MENQIELTQQVVLEANVAISIRKYLGTVPADQVGLQNIVALENALTLAVKIQQEGKNKKSTEKQ